MKKLIAVLVLALLTAGVLGAEELSREPRFNAGKGDGWMLQTPNLPRN
ncbi:MAG: hypothetical protein FWE37_05475 [Spirochaetaceae bacterium]|nr:hypothetical protein [Spirochaetaceae bacterium]